MYAKNIFYKILGVDKNIKMLKQNKTIYTTFKASGATSSFEDLSIDVLERVLLVDLIESLPSTRVGDVLTLDARLERDARILDLDPSRK